MRHGSVSEYERLSNNYDTSKKSRKQQGKGHKARSKQGIKELIYNEEESQKAI